jgi:ATP-dependent RNA helicase DeaD
LQVSNIQQHYLKIDSNKNQILVDLIESLNQDKPVLTLVFVNTKRQVEFISKLIRKEEVLRRKGLVIDFLHGDLRQRKRTKILERFRNKQISLLVTTDVLGRGIDVEGIEYVINYDMPQNPASYTHRIGRTGRAENKGVAITLVNSNEAKELLRTARRQGFKVSEYKLTSRKGEN